jgi:phage-related protein
MRVRQGLKEYLNQVIPLIVSTIKQFKSGVSSDIITQALEVIQQFLECHEPAVIYTHIPSLAQSLIAIINICNEKDKDRVSLVNLNLKSSLNLCNASFFTFKHS